MAEDIQSIIDYYANLLIIQYHDRPKAKATIELIVRELISDGILLDIRDAYSVETAVGVQLDVIGKYVGLNRFYKGQNLSGFLSFINYDEVDAPPVLRVGFSDYTDFDTKVGRFLTYFDVLSSDLVLNDDDFRFLIKMRIIQNHSDHSHKSIDDSIFAFFGDEVRADSEGNMVMYYFVPFTLSELIKVAIQKEVLPRPMGVRLNYIIPEQYPFFGFATYDNTPVFNTGFSNYADYDTKLGETLNFNKLIN